MVSRFSHVQLFATLWTVTHQASLSMGFSRQEYWTGLPCPPPGDPPDPGIFKPVSPALAGGFFTTSATWEAQTVVYYPHFTGEKIEAQRGAKTCSKSLIEYVMKLVVKFFSPGEEWVS